MEHLEAQQFTPKTDDDFKHYVAGAVASVFEHPFIHSGQKLEKIFNEIEKEYRKGLGGIIDADSPFLQYLDEQRSKLRERLIAFKQTK